MTLEKLISEGKCRLEYWGSNLRMSKRQGEPEDHEFKWEPSLHSCASVELMPLTGVLFSWGPWDIPGNWSNGQCLTSQLFLPYPTAQIKVISILSEGLGISQAISCTVCTYLHRQKTEMHFWNHSLLTVPRGSRNVTDAPPLKYTNVYIWKMHF